MKKYAWMSLLGLATACVPGLAQEQDMNLRLKAVVPFDFKVGNETVPAGKYMVVEPIQHFLQLRDERGHVVASTFSNTVDRFPTAVNSVLRFYVQDGQHVLAEVWQEGQTAGERLYRRKVEQESAADEMRASARMNESGRR